MHKNQFCTKAICRDEHLSWPLKAQSAITFKAHFSKSPLTTYAITKNVKWTLNVIVAARSYNFLCLFCCFVIAAILLATAACILGQAQLDYRKPWPTYSLQNMPQTRFTCHDKILGGYYADAETQCQMFHVCVKVSGVGVSASNYEYSTNV